MFLTETRFGHPMYILVQPMYILVHPMYIYVHPMDISLVTFTVHEVQAKLQELQYCMRAQIIDNRLGHVVKYLLTFSFIIIT